VHHEYRSHVTATDAGGPPWSGPPPTRDTSAISTLAREYFAGLSRTSFLTTEPATNGLDMVYAVRFAAPLKPIAASEVEGVSMPYVVGIVLSLGVALFAKAAGFDRDRAFYPTVLIVIASYYVLFAAMSDSIQTVILESVPMTVFVAAAVVGFKSSAWIVVAGLAVHGVFDALHGNVLENAGVPAWWPAFCLAYDLGAAGSLAWLIRRQPHGLLQ
jgi:hypothetical protein